MCDISFRLKVLIALSIGKLFTLLTENPIKFRTQEISRKTTEHVEKVH